MSTLEQLQKNDQIRQAKMFEAMIENFLQSYSPTDRLKAYDFERDLHVLVRQIYRDAQEPLLGQITQIISTIPMYPLIKGA